MKRIVLVCMGVGFGLVSLPVVGSVTYDYGIGGLNLTSTDWILTTSGTDAGTWYTGTLDNALWGVHHSAECWEFVDGNK